MKRIIILIITLVAFTAYANAKDYNPEERLGLIVPNLNGHMVHQIFGNMFISYGSDYDSRIDKYEFVKELVKEDSWKYNPYFRSTGSYEYSYTVKATADFIKIFSDIEGFKFRAQLMGTTGSFAKISCESGLYYIVYYSDCSLKINYEFEDIVAKVIKSEDKRKSALGVNYNEMEIKELADSEVIKYTKKGIKLLQVIYVSSHSSQTDLELEKSINSIKSRTL